MKPHRPGSSSTCKIFFKPSTNRVRIVCRSFVFETHVNGISSSLVVASTCPFIAFWTDHFVFSYLQGLVNKIIVKLMVPLLYMVLYLTAVF